MFRNPGHEFRNADRDAFRSSPPSTTSRSVITSFKYSGARSVVLKLVNFLAERIRIGIGPRHPSPLFVAVVNVNDERPRRRRTGIGLRNTNPLPEKNENRALVPKRTIEIVILWRTRNVIAVAAARKNTGRVTGSTTIAPAVEGVRKIERPVEDLA